VQAAEVKREDAQLMKKGRANCPARYLYSSQQRQRRRSTASTRPAARGAVTGPTMAASLLVELTVDADVPVVIRQTMTSA
jgi:hypothetical protein